MRVDRLSKMKEYISIHGSVTMEELCTAFDVSINTVRRDINNLQKSGDVKKVYGGVTSNNTRTLRQYNERAASNLTAKEQIGTAAAKFITDNDTIFIDAGTTTCEIISNITAKNVTVFTSSLSVLALAASKENLTIILLPGIYSAKTNSVIGSDAAEYLKKFNIQKAFMSASGFIPSKGATHASLEEASIKESALAQSDNAYLLVDSSKFGISTLINYAQSSDFSAIITDKGINDHYRLECVKYRLHLIEA